MLTVTISNKQEHMRRFARFGTICTALKNVKNIQKGVLLLVKLRAECDLVPFVQFLKCEKHPWGNVTFGKVASLKQHSSRGVFHVFKIVQTAPNRAKHICLTYLRLMLRIMKKNRSLVFYHENIDLEPVAM